jgi:hypothetical protein
VSDPAGALAAAVGTFRPGAVATVLHEATVDAPDAFDRVAFEMAFAAAGRSLGSAALGAGATIADATERTWSIAGWGLDEAGRALLLLRGIGCLPASEQPAWVDGLYRAGAMRERQAVLRVLALLPEPARFLAIALDACRASTQPVFEAIACENPYPAAYFPEASFNQMVLKAVFTEVPLARILGLDARRTPDLVRMASDYADERRAAGRTVPTDLARLIDP